MRGKEYFLIILSTVFSLLIALGAFRYFAPELLGVPADLKIVQLDSAVSPFYSGIFREEDARSTSFLINDPVVGVRAKPLLPELLGVGPHDVLGFRNSSVPSRPHVIVIGDSQTYGINALHEASYPAQLQKHLGSDTRVYSMALGGWSALQYLHMAKRAVFFEPELVIVTLYTGNDILETFRTAYAHDYWKSRRADTGLSLEDAPAVIFPPPENDRIRLDFVDGTSSAFTPRHRLLANDREDQVIQEGLRILKSALDTIVDTLRRENITPFVVIIPSKELAFSKKIAEGTKSMPQSFVQLIQNESRNIEEITSFLSTLDVDFLSLVQPLGEALTEDISLYPRDTNGHPNASGYALIASLVSEQVKEMVKPVSDGLYKVTNTSTEAWYFRVQEGIRYELSAKQRVREGLTGAQFKEISFRDLARIPLKVNVVKK